MEWKKISKEKPDCEYGTDIIVKQILDDEGTSFFFVATYDEEEQWHSYFFYPHTAGSITITRPISSTDEWAYIK